ncbi:MAG: HEAT repeat domain-containing protein, partial [Aureliella sp.]
MRIAIAIGLSLLAWVCHGEAIRAQSPASAENARAEKTESGSERDWARDYIAEDPLVAKETITLDDIREGLASPERRGTVIDRHFNRVEQATPKEKRDFLVEALKSEHPEVQRQAARQLSAQGELESIVRDLLLEYLRSDDAALREVAVIALEHIDLGRQQWPEEYWTALIEGLGSQDPETVRSVAQRLESQGPSAVPALLAALRDGKPQVQRGAARVLAKIVGSRPAFFGTKSGGGAPRPTPPAPSQPAPTLPRSATPTAPAPSPPQVPAPAPEARGKTPEISPPVHTARQVDPERPQTVRVYFGTNREEFAPEQPPWSKLLLYPVVAALLVVGVIYSWWHPRESQRRGCVSLVLTVCFVLGVAWSLAVFRTELLDRWRIGTGPRFGPRRDPGAVVHYGTCDVSIPPRHEVGKIETPLLGPEDENLHVVLKKTEELEEAAFFEAVRTRLASLP